MTTFSSDQHAFDLMRRVKSGGPFSSLTPALQGTHPGLGLKRASILVVDDSEPLRETVVTLLNELGYGNVSQAENGEKAIEAIQRTDLDLIITDIDMPRLDGYGLLARLKSNDLHRHIPVIVLSASGDLDAAVRCIGLGAEDFLPKPMHPVLLQTRVAASLERKRLRDLERIRLKEAELQRELLEFEAEKSDQLLLNILPRSIADRLKAGAHTIAERFECATVLFADLANFTEFANKTDPHKVVVCLNDLVSRFDTISEDLGVEKIKTIGDGYLAVAGVPTERPDHAEAAANMALAMFAALADFNRERGAGLGMRIGLNSGPVVAGVIGRRKFTYDLWGNAVNLASRMESAAPPNSILCPADTADLLRARFRLTDHGLCECKGLGPIPTYTLDGLKA